MQTYRWNNPHEWIAARITQLLSESPPAIEELATMLRDLLAKIDADTIQDTFQSEMDADGYFQPLTDNRD